MCACVWAGRSQLVFTSFHTVEYSHMGVIHMGVIHMGVIKSLVLHLGFSLIETLYSVKLLYKMLCVDYFFDLLFIYILQFVLQIV